MLRGRWPERAQIHATGDDLYAHAGDAVQPLQLIPLVAAGYRHAVRSSGDHPFALCTELTRWTKLGCRAHALALQTLYCVKHRHMGNVPGARQREARDTRQPVVAVDDIVGVPVPLGKPHDTPREFIDVHGERAGGERSGGAGLHAYQTRAFAQGLDGRIVGVGPAGEDVNQDAIATKLAAQLTHVHIHATGVAGAPQARQRGGVQAQHRNSNAHAHPSPSRRR